MNILPTFKQIITKFGVILVAVIFAFLPVISSAQYTQPLPTQAGHAGEFLETDGLNLSWAAAGGATSTAIEVGTTAIGGGTDGSVFYNDGGLFGEDNPNLFYDDTDKTLTVAGLQTAGTAGIDIGFSQGIRLEADGSAYFNDNLNTNSELNFKSATHANLLFAQASTSNVGINRGTPLYSLDVNGTLRQVSDVTANASTTDYVTNLLSNSFTVAGALVDSTLTAHSFDSSVTSGATDDLTGDSSAVGTGVTHTFTGDGDIPLFAGFTSSAVNGGTGLVGNVVSMVNTLFLGGTSNQTKAYLLSPLIFDLGGNTGELGILEVPAGTVSGTSATNKFVFNIKDTSKSFHEGNFDIGATSSFMINASSTLSRLGTNDDIISIGEGGSGLTAGAQGILLTDANGYVTPNAGGNFFLGGNGVAKNVQFSSGNCIGQEAAGSSATGRSVVGVDCFGYQSLYNIANGAQLVSAFGSTSGSLHTTGWGASYLGSQTNTLAPTANAQTAVGAGSTTTEANQFVSGSEGYAMNNVYFAKGYSSNSATSSKSFTLHGTNGKNNNNNGGWLKIAGGWGTGIGDEGIVGIQTSQATSTGSTIQELEDIFVWSEDVSSSLKGESINITNVTNSTYSVALDDNHISFQYTSTGVATSTLPLISDLYKDGQLFTIYDQNGNAGTNAITVVPTGGDTITGTTSATIGVNNMSITFIANKTTSDWEIH